MRYFIQFAYRGTDFHGSQSQPNALTVQQCMEEALATILRRDCPLVFAGRTDAGVHAREMWAHLDSDEALPENIVMRLNSLLPESIAIYNIVRVCADAHARFDATRRTYRYYITTRKDPFVTDTRTRVAPGLDFEKMNKAAELMIGRRDFASFCRSHTDVKTTICDVSEAYWTRESETEAFFTISADRFLRNMVRAVVGTLMEVGRGKRSIDDFQAVLDAKSRSSAGQSAEARGLFLEQIEYKKTIFTPFLDN